MWAMNYEDTLQEWQELRNTITTLELDDSLHLINDWWQQAPTIPHYLHFDDHKQWPGPWDILADETFCDTTKILGILYTILLMDLPEDSTFFMLQDENTTYLEVNIDSKKYIFANEIGIINSKFNKSEIINQIDCNYLKNTL